MKKMWLNIGAVFLCVCVILAGMLIFNTQRKKEAKRNESASYSYSRKMAREDKNSFNTENSRLDAFGDSIVHGYNGSDDKVMYNPYIKIVATSFGMSLDNHAINQATVSGNADKDIYKQIEKANLKYTDYVYISAGVNDYYAKARLTTVKNKLQSEIDLIRKKNKTVKILAALPLPAYKTAGQTTLGTGDAYNAANSLGLNLSDYCDALMEVYSKNNIPVLDYRGAQPWNISDFKTATIDGIHPTEKSHEKLAKKVISFFRVNIKKE